MIPPTRIVWFLVHVVGHAQLKNTVGEGSCRKLFVAHVLLHLVAAGEHP